jgi:hypothetical protein
VTKKKSVTWVVELRRLNDERHGLEEFRFRYVGRDVDVSRVPVELEVLVFVVVAAERVKYRRPEAEVFVEGLQLLRLNHQLLAFGATFGQEGFVTFVKECRILGSMLKNFFFCIPDATGN